MNETKQNYGQRLARNKELAQQGQAHNFERASLLVAVYEDQEFLSFAQATDQEPLDLLDEECGDLCCSFMQLKLIRERFPNSADWYSQRLQHMLAIVLDERTKADRTRSAPRPSWKQKFEELEKEHAKTVRDLDLTAARLAELEKVFAQTRAA